MPYSKQTWSDNNPTYPLSAARMGVIEQGIFDAAAVADQGHRILTTSAKNALTGVVTGTQVYDSTLGQHQTYNGTAWQSFGLTLTATGSFSAVSNADLTSIFTATYENYRLVMQYGGSAVSTGLNVRLMSGTTPDTTANNYQMNSISSSESGTLTGVVSTDSAWLNLFTADNTSTVGNLIIADVLAPFVSTRRAMIIGQHFSSLRFHRYGAGAFLSNTSLNGLRFYPNAGTLTGQYWVYGYGA